MCRVFRLHGGSGPGANGSMLARCTMTRSRRTGPRRARDDGACFRRPATRRGGSARVGRPTWPPCCPRASRRRSPGHLESADGAPLPRQIGELQRPIQTLVARPPLRAARPHRRRRGPRRPHRRRRRGAGSPRRGTRDAGDHARRPPSRRSRRSSRTSPRSSIAACASRCRRARRAAVRQRRQLLTLPSRSVTVPRAPAAVASMRGIPRTGHGRAPRADGRRRGAADRVGAPGTSLCCGGHRRAAGRRWHGAERTAARGARSRRWPPRRSGARRQRPRGGCGGAARRRARPGGGRARLDDLAAATLGPRAGRRRPIRSSNGRAPAASPPTS